MKDRVIVYSRPDGQTCIVNPVPWVRKCKAITLDGKRLVYDPPLQFERVYRSALSADTFDKHVKRLSVEWAETEDEFMARIQAKSVPKDATNISIVDRSKVPTDRTYRNAWKHDLSLDAAKVKEIDQAKSSPVALLSKT